MEEITSRDRRLAELSVKCPICSRARKNPGGLAYFFVRHVEKGSCRACKAYEKVYGCKSWEYPTAPQAEE